ncbi:hypothetical protein PsYK624_081330 [Phanerochaete sordida]|uniref:Uncharacterized protein n=1 Tax=Phanerochaete sordida TaxID=48140 RepID=A0A9P3GDV0_9APHY|nr:hypothetical protein PsYK624_081330 [Phanerochaete sordida]
MDHGIASVDKDRSPRFTVRDQHRPLLLICPTHHFTRSHSDVAVDAKSTNDIAGYDTVPIWSSSPDCHVRTVQLDIAGNDIQFEDRSRNAIWRT